MTREMLHTYFLILCRSHSSREREGTQKHFKYRTRVIKEDHALFAAVGIG